LSMVASPRLTRQSRTLMISSTISWEAINS
jgi:hypothetical protein